jgi:hypothetical protein
VVHPAQEDVVSVKAQPFTTPCRDRRADGVAGSGVTPSVLREMRFGPVPGDDPDIDHEWDAKVGGEPGDCVFVDREGDGEVERLALGGVALSRLGRRDVGGQALGDDHIVASEVGRECRGSDATVSSIARELAGELPLDGRGRHRCRPGGLAIRACDRGQVAETVGSPQAMGCVVVGEVEPEPVMDRDAGEGRHDTGRLEALPSPGHSGVQERQQLVAGDREPGGRLRDFVRGLVHVHDRRGQKLVEDLVKEGRQHVGTFALEGVGKAGRDLDAEQVGHRLCLADLGAFGNRVTKLVATRRAG